MILAVDTCLAVCQAALVCDGATLAERREDMARGHQERLAPMVAEVLRGHAFAELQAIAVTVGPGSFTGLRVGIAFAKGLAVALDRPCFGVGTLTALAAATTGRRASVIDAGRGAVWLQVFDDDGPVAPPASIPVEDLAGHAAGAVLVGPQASTFAAGARAVDLSAPRLSAVAALAMAHRALPAPLYLRAPDAAPKAMTL